MSYTTQMDAAKQGIITPEMEIVAKKEMMDAQELRSLVAEGKVAIPANKNHKTLSPEGIGQGLRTKINVNLGISRDAADVEKELEKVRTAIDMKAEAIMDLSNYGKTKEMRRRILDMSPAMLGTVPIYDAIGYCEKKLKDITKEDFMKLRMEDKLNELRNFLPKIIFANGYNQVYSKVSNGIHNLSEDECNNLFIPLRMAIEEILIEKLELRERKIRQDNLGKKLQNI